MRRSREEDVFGDGNSSVRRRSDHVEENFGSIAFRDGFESHRELLDAKEALRKSELLKSLSSDMHLPNSLWSHVFVWASTEEQPATTEQLPPDWQIDSFYLKQILGLQSDKEREYKVNKEYLRFHPDLSSSQRASLIQLMITATRRFQFTSEILHQAVGIVDRYLSVSRNIKAFELEEIGIAALLLSYKNEAAYAPLFPLENVCALMSFDPQSLHQRVLQRELTILMTMNWNVFAPSTISCLRRLFFMMGDQNYTFQKVCSCLAERSLLEFDMLKFLPSTIAATVYTMACATISKIENEEQYVKTPCWSPAVHACSQVDQELIVPCLEMMVRFLQQETLARTIRFAYKKLKSIHNITSLVKLDDPYEALLLWTSQEIEVQTNKLAKFVAHSEQDLQRKTRETSRLEYIAYVPGILEFSAKLRILSDVSATPHTHSVSYSNFQSANVAIMPLDDSMLSSVTDREDSTLDGSSFLSDTLDQSPILKRDHVTDSIASSWLSKLSEEAVTAVVNQLLSDPARSIHSSLPNPNLADSVFHRYSDVYHYLVTCPPINE